MTFILLLARAATCVGCLSPFGFTLRETAFASWVGLRGAVPIYLTTIPILRHVAGAQLLLAPTVVVVVASLVVQGWTIGPVAQLLGFARPTRPGPRRLLQSPAGPRYQQNDADPAREARYCETLTNRQGGRP